jgi:hypothetical protein
MRRAHSQIRAVMLSGAARSGTIVTRSKAESKNLLSICSQLNQCVDYATPQHFRRFLPAVEMTALMGLKLMGKSRTDLPNVQECDARKDDKKFRSR